jgi:hypothetical protein
MVEERGLSRSILNNPDLRPQTDTKTKFADVKGVDEAKVWRVRECVHACQRAAVGVGICSYLEGGGGGVSWARSFAQCFSQAHVLRAPKYKRCECVDAKGV